MLELRGGGVYELVEAAYKEARDAVEKNVEAQREAQQQHGKSAVSRVGGIRRRGEGWWPWFRLLEYTAHAEHRCELLEDAAGGAVRAGLSWLLGNAVR